jgi:hypothetical protein
LTRLFGASPWNSPTSGYAPGSGDDLVQTLLQDVEDPAEPEDGDGKPHKPDYHEHS